MESIRSGIAMDTPGRIRFLGPREARRFTRELDESILGILTRLFMPDDRVENAGFLATAVDGRPWWDTMWTRDAGVVLRELALWGYCEHAVLLARSLIGRVKMNPEGYLTFPQFFANEMLIRNSRWKRTREWNPEDELGSELDGTSAIVVGLALLEERLPPLHPEKKTIRGFLSSSSSPVAYILAKTETSPLLAGTGEFGGGMGVHDPYINIVQNNLARLALLISARLFRSHGDDDPAKRAEAAAERLGRNILQYLVGPDGSWLWCIDPNTMQPDEKVLNHECNRDASLINGALAMCADVLGLDASRYDPAFLDASRRTFDRLMENAFRREQFEKHGAYAIFDHFFLNVLTSASYGNGYAIQCMLLLDRLDQAEHALEYLANATCRPPATYRINRSSRYYFYERYYSPDLVGKVVFEEGCGALNPVNVAEPMKVARLIVGIDDSDENRLLLLPKVPASWKGYHVQNWPIRTRNGIRRCDIEWIRTGSGVRFSLSARDGTTPALQVRHGGRVYDFESDTAHPVVLPG